jgi:ABC-type amino acid transport substrate-binding protein
MKKVSLVALCLMMYAGSLSAKSLLEKALYFINPTTSKVDSAKYWKVFVGSYPATLQRKFPGEEMATVQTDLNLTLLSSGYVEGYGYSNKGRIDCEAVLFSDSAATQKISFDSIEYVYNGGQNVKMKNKPSTSLYLDVEGNRVTIYKGLLLTRYRLTIVDEDRNLKPAGDATITFFAFSKQALLAAQKADKGAETQNK